MHLLFRKKVFTYYLLEYCLVFTLTHLNFHQELAKQKYIKLKLLSTTANYFKPSSTTIEKLYDNHHFSAVPTKYLGLHAALIQGQYLMVNTVSGIRSRYLKKKSQAVIQLTHLPPSLFNTF